MSGRTSRTSQYKLSWPPFVRRVSPIPPTWTLGHSELSSVSRPPGEILPTPLVDNPFTLTLSPSIHIASNGTLMSSRPMIGAVLGVDGTKEQPAKTEASKTASALRCIACTTNRPLSGLLDGGRAQRRSPESRTGSSGYPMDCRLRHRVLLVGSAPPIRSCGPANRSQRAWLRTDCRRSKVAKQAGAAPLPKTCAPALLGRCGGDYRLEVGFAGRVLTFIPPTGGCS